MSDAKAETKAPETSAADVKRPRKLTKAFEGNVLVLTEATTGTALRFDLDTLPQASKDNLFRHGAAQKLGDAAAGEAGKDAIEAINSVWESLTKGEWSTRAPAAPKVTKKDIMANLSAMSEKDQAAAKAMLEKLGIKL